MARLLVRRQDWKISKIREKLAEKGLDEPILAKNTKFHGEMTAERGLKAAFNLSWEELHSEPEAQILALYLSLFALAPFPKGMILDMALDSTLSPLSVNIPLPGPSALALRLWLSFG